MRQGLMQPPAGGAPAPAPGPAEAMPAEPTSESGVEGEAATPEEQAQYDELMGTLFGLIHTGKTKEQTLKRLKAGKENPGQTIGEMSNAMFSAVEDNIEANGGSIPDAVRMEVGEDLVAELVQVAVLIKLVPDEEEAIGHTMNAAIDVFASGYGNARRDAGKVNPEEMKGQLQELGGRAQAEFGGKPPSQPNAMAQGVKQASGEM